MDRINANDFRANLKEWMEAARSEPVKITRKSGEAFVLIDADAFEKMQIELSGLRGVAQGLSDAVQGRTRKVTDDLSKSVIDRAKDRVLSKRSKKAAS